MANDLGGVWRTVGGRRIFIKDGKDLKTAMKESGKFKSKKDKEKEDRLKDMEHDIKWFEEMEKKYPTKGGLENNEDYKTLVEDYNNLSKELGHEKSDFSKRIETEKQTQMEYEHAKDKYEHYKFDNSEEAQKYRDEYNKAKDNYVKASREVYEKEADKEIKRMGSDPKEYNLDAREDIINNLKGKEKTKNELKNKGYEYKYGEDIKYKDNDGNTKEGKFAGVGVNGEVYLQTDNEWVVDDTSIDLVISKTGRGEDGKAIDFNRKDETFKYNGSYNDNVMKKARQDSVMVETLGSRAVDEIRNGNITNEKQLYEFLETGSAYNGSKVVHGYGYGYYDLSHNMVWRDDLKGTKADKEITAQAKYWRDKATNELQQKTLPQRYKGTVEYLKNTTNMTSAEILKMLKEIDKDNKK